MTIEDKIFFRKRFDRQRLTAFGFVEGPEGYRFGAELMGGDFSAELIVAGDGKLTGRVTDNMSGEEYFQLRVDGLDGPFVNSVRAEYENLLRSVAENCCTDVLFASDQANRIADNICSAYGVSPDYPWEQSQFSSFGVFRHADNQKWFALIMNVRRSVLDKGSAEAARGGNAGCSGESVSGGNSSDSGTKHCGAEGNDSMLDIINLKAVPSDIASLVKRNGIHPAYHMDRKHWISVRLDDTIGDNEVMELVDGSFGLTEKKRKK